MFSLKICLTSLLMILIVLDASLLTLHDIIVSSVTYPKVWLTSCLNASIFVIFTFTTSLPSHRASGNISPQLINFLSNDLTIAVLISSVCKLTSPISIGASGAQKMRLISQVKAARGFSFSLFIFFIAILIVSILLIRIASFYRALAPNSPTPIESRAASLSTWFLTST